MIRVVFVTGNAKKLNEVKAILADGPNPIEIDSQALDSKFYSASLFN